MNNCGWVRNGGKCILEQENKKYKEVIDKLKKYIRLIVSEEEFIETEHYVELLEILKEVE